jgi:hypothetical protein
MESSGQKAASFSIDQASNKRAAGVAGSSGDETPW